jgi:ubiquinone/menaquinone biosynthesis C-methylase UbiE
MSYAHAWSRWFDVIEGGAQALTAQMIDGIDFNRVKHALDIGTGLGEPATTVALSLPPGGRVTAVDPDAHMVDFARARASRMQATNIDFVVASLESADLEESGFDLITARWSLMFSGDKLAALRKLNHLLRPHGRTAVGLWKQAELVPALTLAEWAIFDHFGWPQEEMSTRQAFSMADEDKVVALFIEAGFEDIAVTPCEVVYTFESPNSYIQYRQDVNDAVWSRVSNLPQSDRDEAKVAVENAMEKYKVPDGTFRVVSLAYTVSATRS